MPVIFSTGLGKVLRITHIGVWVKTKINILYPRCKFNIYYFPTCFFRQGLIEEEIALEEAYRHKLENASANRKQRGSKMSKVAGTSDEDERFSEYPEAATNELTKGQCS